MHGGDFGLDICQGFDVGDAIQERFDGCVSIGFGLFLVHTDGEEIANFLCDASFGMGLLHRFLDEVLNLLAILLPQKVESAKSTLVGGQGIGLHPATVGIQVEIFSGIDAEVQVRPIDGHGSLGTSRDEDQN